MYALPAGPIPAPRRQTLVGSAFAAVAIVMLDGGMLAVWLLQAHARRSTPASPGCPSGVVIPEVPANIILIAFVGLCVFAQWAVWSAKRNDRGHTVFALGATVAGGAADHQRPGLHLLRDGPRHRRRHLPAMFYAVTGVFMVLMVVGILFSAVAAFRCSGGRTGDHEILAAHAMYWYTMAAVFTALWFVVYVTK